MLKASPSPLKLKQQGGGRGNLERLVSRGPRDYHRGKTLGGVVERERSERRRKRRRLYIVVR